MEASASVEIAKHTLMSGGLILAVGTVAGLLAHKLKIPDVAVFLVVGMLIGPEALGLINIRADFGAEPDFPPVRRQLHSFRRRRLAAIRCSKAGLDHDRADRHGRCGD